MNTKILDKNQVVVNQYDFSKDSGNNALILSSAENEVNSISGSVEGTYSNIADRLLENEKMTDAGILGSQINMLISTAKEYDPEKFKKKGIFSKIRNVIVGAKDQIIANSESIKERIDRVIADMDKQIALHERRQTDLSELYQYNRTYHDQLTLNIKKCEALSIALSEEKAKIDSLLDNDDTFAAADSNAIQMQIYRIDALSENLKNNRTRSKQVALEIDSIKQTGLNLIQVVKTTKSDLIPNWKFAFIQFVTSNEQSKSISYTENAQKATNESLIALGNQISENAQKSATLLNTTTIKMETLEVLNNKLIDANESVNKIYKQAAEERKANAIKRDKIEKDILENMK